MLNKRKWKAIFSVIEESKEVDKLLFVFELPALVNPADITLHLQREMTRKFGQSFPYDKSSTHAVILEQLAPID